MPPTTATTATTPPAIHGQRFFFLVSISMVTIFLTGECGDRAVTDELNDLDGDDQRDDRGDHDVVVETVVAVCDCEISDAACADRSGDGRVLDHGDGVDCQGSGQRGQRLGQLNRADHLYRRAAAGL